MLPYLLRLNTNLPSSFGVIDVSVLIRRLCILGYDAALIKASFWGALALRLNGEAGPQLASTSYLMPVAIA